MELRNITTFLKVAATQNFSKAAEQLGYSQSAVSIQMQQLEKELGTKLFERIGKNVNLTPHGEAFIYHANEIMRVTNAAASFASSASVPEGRLRIGSVNSIATAVLPDLLLEFYHACPKVETVVVTGSLKSLMDMIKSNDIDLFFTLEHKVYGLEWIRPIQRQEDIVFVTSSENPLVHQKKISLPDLIKEPFLLTEMGASYRYELERILSEKDLIIKPVMEIGDTEAILHLLKKGVGVSFMPMYAVQESMKEGSLSQIQTDMPALRMWSQLLYHKNKWVTPQMNVFINIAQDFFKSRGWITDSP